MGERRLPKLRRRLEAVLTLEEEEEELVVVVVVVGSGCKLRDLDIDGEPGDCLDLDADG